METPSINGLLGLEGHETHPAAAEAPTVEAVAPPATMETAPAAPPEASAEPQTAVQQQSATVVDVPSAPADPAPNPAGDVSPAPETAPIPATEAAAADEPSATEAAAEQSLEDRYAALLSQYDALLRQTGIQPQQPAPQPAAPEPAAEPVAPAAPAWVSEAEHDDAIASPQGMNKLFDKVAQQLAATVYERALQQIPQAVLPMVQRTVDVGIEYRRFAAANPELVKLPGLLMQHVAAVQGEQPDAPFAQQIAEAGTRMRHQLGMGVAPAVGGAAPVAVQTAPAATAPRVPQFAQPPRGAAPDPAAKPSGAAQYITETLGLGGH